jgi:hypothetical protein
MTFPFVVIVVLVDQFGVLNVETYGTNKQLVGACIVVTDKHLGTQPLSHPAWTFSRSKACDEPSARLQPIDDPPHHAASVNRSR